MATKTQKRQTIRHKEEVKAASERMQNLDEASIARLENYAVYQILYLNDVACNACKFLGDELKTIPYKSKAVKTIYGALMKRVNAYWEFVNMAKIDQYSLAELFGEMDDYLDDRVAEFRQAMIDCLADTGIDHPHWVAQVESAMTLCDYAVTCAKDYIRSISNVSSYAPYMLGLVIEEIYKVAKSMSEMVQTIHVGKIVVDLNNDPRVARSFKRLNKAFVSPDNFIIASKTADAANAEEGRMKLM